MGMLVLVLPSLLSLGSVGRPGPQLGSSPETKAASDRHGLPIFDSGLSLSE